MKSGIWLSRHRAYPRCAVDQPPGWNKCPAAIPRCAIVARNAATMWCGTHR